MDLGEATLLNRCQATGRGNKGLTTFGTTSFASQLATGGPRALRAVGLDCGLPKVSGASRSGGLLGGLVVGLGVSLRVSLRSFLHPQDNKDTPEKSPRPTRHPGGDPRGDPRAERPQRPLGDHSRDPDSQD